MLNWIEMDTEKIVKFQGILGDNGLHLPSYFIAGGRYKYPKNNAFLAKFKNTNILANDNSKKCWFVIYDKNFDINNISSIAKDFLNFRGYNKGKRKISVILNNEEYTPEYINNFIGYPCEYDKYYEPYWFNIYEEKEYHNEKWQRKHQILKMINLCEMRLIDNDEEYSKIKKEFKEWLRVKKTFKDSADYFGGFAFNRFGKYDLDYCKLYGIYLAGELVGYQSLSPYGNDSLFIYLENCIEEKFSYFDDVVVKVTKLYEETYNEKDKYNFVRKILKHSLKRVMHCTILRDITKYYPNIKVMNIDGIGIKNDKLLAYKQKYFRHNTKALKITIL